MDTRPGFEVGGIVQYPLNPVFLLRKTNKLWHVHGWCEGLGITIVVWQTGSPREHFT